RDGTAMLLTSGPDPTADGYAVYWPGSSNNGQRPCLYDDEFTFGRDGSYTYNDATTYWAEFGVFNGVDGCDSDTIAESCFDVSSGSAVNECGDDVSAWLSGTHSFEYNSSTGKITLTGNGAWIGIPKLGTTTTYLTPQPSVIFDAVLREGGESGVDTLFASFSYDGNFWPITYVSYSDASLEPELVTEFVEPPCENLAAISPSVISHTFASNDSGEWDEIQPDNGSGHTLELGVADPEDAAALVGKITRNANQFEEMIFRFEGNSINFENLNTLTMDVYLPSTNDYTGDLQDAVRIGFGNIQCPPFWYEDQHEWTDADLAKDQWITLTIDLSTAADFVNKPDNGATLKDRNDIDMMYINFGGANHFASGSVYVRNLEMN
ncbi:MAG: hypothetical protein AB8B73_05980, partial [Ekhidna sp.]